MAKHEGSTFRARLFLRRIPRRIVAVWIILTAVKGTPARRFPLDNLTAALRAVNPRFF